MTKEDLIESIACVVNFVLKIGIGSKQDLNLDILLKSESATICVYVNNVLY